MILIHNTGNINDNSNDNNNGAINEKDNGTKRRWSPIIMSELLNTSQDFDGVTQPFEVALHFNS